MPWTTPTLAATRGFVRDYVLTQLGAKAMVPNSALRIMSDTMAGLANMAYLYLDWLAKQLMPDTAEKEWLDRHGQIWLVNADGSKGRQAGTYARHGAICRRCDARDPGWSGARWRQWRVVSDHHGRNG
jgi:uncharacterized phage protein gp47/JayE